jgi:hypothetical protein
MSSGATNKAVVSPFNNGAFTDTWQHQ